MKTHALDNETATLALGAALAMQCAGGTIIHLRGPLGAGKTTLVRGMLQALGHKGRVKSPTYSLVESYELGEKTVHHFDLYRLGDAEEIEWMGLRDYLTESALALIEWPERGEGFLPPPDLDIQLDYGSSGRIVQLRSEQPDRWSLFLTGDFPEIGKTVRPPSGRTAS